MADKDEVIQPHPNGSSGASEKGVGGNGPSEHHHLEEKAASHATVDGADLEALNHNVEGRIKNPLAGIPYDQLMRDVEAFVEEKGLTEHVAVFKQGALVAQDPDSYDSLPGEHALNDAEITVLRNEVEHRWRMPWRLVLTIATCSIGAAVQGWDQTGINGANPFMTEAYGLQTNENDVRNPNALILGVVNAAPYFASALIGCWLSDPINNWLGRRGAIFISGHFCLWPVIGSAFSHRWEDQLACRILMGIGMGLKGSTVPIYAAENAPASVRGALVMSWQMWTAFGIFLGTVVNLAVYDSPINWHLMLGAPFIPAVPLVLLIYFCPESPRWLMKKNRYVDAWKALNRLRYNQVQCARDMYYIHSQLVLEYKVVGDSGYVQRFVELFTIPRVRRATLAAFTVMLAQQLCGINMIAFYSTTVFIEAGSSPRTAMISSMGVGLVNWLFAFPAFWTIDTFGRRSLLLFTFPQMTWTLLAAGLCTLIEQGTARTALVALFVYLFEAFYSPGEGPVPFTYSAEVFPLSHREVGMGFAVATCLFWAGILSMTFPMLVHDAKVVGAFGVYAGFNVVAFIMIFLWVPETKQRTLEELDYIFGAPTSKFIKYQVTETLPFWFKRYVLFQRKATLRPFFQSEERPRRRANAEISPVVGNTKA